jgi:hypothetical protein
VNAAVLLVGFHYGYALLTGNRSYQCHRRGRLSIKPRAGLVQSLEQRMPGRINVAHITEGNNKRAIADHRASSPPRLFHFEHSLPGKITLQFDPERYSQIVNIKVQTITFSLLKGRSCCPALLLAPNPKLTQRFAAG